MGKSDGESKPFFSAKRKRMVIKLLIIAAIAGVGYVLVNPSVIKNPEQREQVMNIRDQVLSLNSITQGKLQDGFPIVQKLTAQVNSIAKSGLVLGDQEIVVEDVVKQVTGSLETLPTQQFKQFKTDFCADLVSAAAREATEAGNTQ